MFLRIDVDASDMVGRSMCSDHRVFIREQEARYRPWPHHLHCRRRAHKAFLRWYAANESNFAVKLELLKRTDQTLETGFAGISRVLTAGLSDDEINVWVDWQGQCWDILRCFETSPKRVPGGYVCDLCPEHDRPLYPIREHLWRAEVFEPFLEWVNRALANAEAVSISGTPEWATWAKLVTTSSERANK